MEGNISGEMLEIVKKEIENFWPGLKENLRRDKIVTGVKFSDGWLDYLLECNVSGGKKFRGLGMVLFFRSYFDEHLLANNREITNFEEEIVTKDQLYALAWAIEIFQAACLIADDLMDNSTTRRAKPCWHLVEGVGLLAVNDALLLENVAYRILDKYCKRMSFYAKLTRVFHKTGVRTLLGEHLDIKSELRNINMSMFIEERYAKIIEYKTSYYTFCLPAKVAMILAGRKDKHEYKMVEEIFMKIIHLFQVQDDYLDCFGDPKVTGKIGTDIVDGKCTWPIVRALQLASAEQKQGLQQFYGNPDDEARVKTIYKELSMPKEFIRYEDKTCNEIREMVASLREDIPRVHINYMLDTIYRRKK